MRCKPLLLALPLAALAACSVGPTQKAPALELAPGFQAPLPAAGAAQPASALAGWWRQFDDPAVLALVEAAQASHPQLEQALARIAQARAGMQASGAARWPNADLNLRGERFSQKQRGQPAVITHAVSRSVDASWELDLFGGRRQAVAAAEARLQARQAEWRAAQVSLAAEVAANVVGHRACSAAARLLEQDAASRDKTSELARLKIKAGFSSDADVMLSEASAADARQRVAEQRAECDVLLKSLVALSGLPEAQVQALLAPRDTLPRPRAIAVDTVPAVALGQRPDLAAVSAELQAAAAEVNVAHAARYPQLTLGGSIGVVRLAGGSSALDTWSVLPQLSLPLFDGGRRRAEQAGAQARYDELAGLYRERARAAVRETEQALVRLDAAGRREADAASAARDYDRYFHASGERYKAGPASMFELEDARRSALAAQLTLLGVQQQRVLAWIALYKALGGGWQAGAAAMAAP
ncbi:efflux transporter, outer membrane factor (OMF) lipoprotein, NodT family [Duganella sp. CF458]|uniref:efflux transporter outer membrane subunit n=1 Tax=Duganella sp. CF458 TaxID=1884368 RepID=UPI0008E70D9F|nr:efflux transporter outer membrane subunit [Duganella sp. CF458]SFH00128.1 efflux transporter, outer membrane factor (OMF) lipoprotein, NodT family [Duganella sp. CF458]